MSASMGASGGQGDDDDLTAIVRAYTEMPRDWRPIFTAVVVGFAAGLLSERDIAAAVGLLRANQVNAARELLEDRSAWRAYLDRRAE